MATDQYTSQLNLIKTDPQNPIDVDKINTSFQRIDDGYGKLPLYASETARNSAYANSPFNLCVVGSNYDSGTVWRRKNGKWYALDPTRVAWVPTLKGSSSNPSGFTVTGYYIRNGDMVHAEGFISSSGTSFRSGSGYYKIAGFPKPTFTLGRDLRGVAYVYQLGGGATAGFLALSGDELTILAPSSPSSLALVGDSSPWNWTTSAMSIGFTFDYMMA